MRFTNFLASPVSIRRSSNALILHFKDNPINNSLSRSKQVGAMAASTPAQLKRWSCIGKDQKDLPTVSRVKAIHIYDFDNTLFHSPLPNAKLWTSHTISLLQNEDAFVNGGWWHDNRLLEATGEGLEKEEAKAWEGWWNEDIAKLVRLSMSEDDALTVLLTGRGEKKFTNVINRMVKAKKLDFDMVCLKQAANANGRPYSSTMVYKQALIRDLLLTYHETDEVKIYEDRPRHVTGFREYLQELNLDAIRGEFPGRGRRPISGQVIAVPAKTVSLDPVRECSEIQNMINIHNATNPHPRLQMKRTVFFTGYLLSQADADRMVSLLEPGLLRTSDMKVLANNIMISPRPATEAVLAKVGGLGAKQMWQVQAVGNFNGGVYAAKVVPMPASATVNTESHTPMVVLATLRGAKAIDSQRITNWQPVPSDKQFAFETTVGEKVQLRIEAEIEGESEYDSLFPKPHGQGLIGQKRKGAADNDDRPGRDDRRVSNGFRGGRGGRDRERDRGDRRGRRDRDMGARGGRGGRENQNDRQHRKQQQRTNNYRSLDDVSNGQNIRNDNFSAGGYEGGQNGAPRYDSDFPPLGGPPPKHTGGYDGNDDGGLHY